MARVLQRMNPDVLQKVTQEILRPIIEALVKDELNPKVATPVAGNRLVLFKQPSRSAW